MISESVKIKKAKNGKWRSSDIRELCFRNSVGKESVVITEKSADRGICISLSARCVET